MSKTSRKRHSPRPDRIVQLGTLWFLLCLAFLADVEAPGISDVIVFGALGAALIAAGRFFGRRCGAIRPKRTRPQPHLAAMSLGAGIAAGTVILVVEIGLANFDPGIQASFARYYPEAWWRPFQRAFPPAVMEEVIARYVLMSAVAVAAIRYATSGDRAYAIALVTSAVIFGLLHGPSPDLVGLALLLLNTAGGLLLGWIFWYWGLAHSILCHFAGGVVIQSLGPRLLA